ncbi:MAG: methyltransferase domain-containing protein [Acidimicrobiia bacterium]
MDIFGGEAMADGYDSARPPLHGLIMERVALALHWAADPAGSSGAPTRTVVDIGCGAGASTVAARPWADRLVGLDPAPTMVKRAARRHRDARFGVATGLAVPIRSGAVDVLVAAGSLNFMDLAAFRAEADRVLAPDGVVIAYDFATGRRSPADPTLAAAYDEFAARWPRPVANRHGVDPEVLVAAGFALHIHAASVLTLTMTADDYTRYLMTETNVAGAVERGQSRDEIERWCRRRFAPAFAAPRPVEFECWYAVAEPGVSADHVCEQ